MSTVPIFKVPCARAAIGRKSNETSVKDSNFFIRGLNKSSETGHTASANIGLKLVADAEVEMAVVTVPSCVNGKPVIEAQWSNRQIEAKPEHKTRGEAIESAQRADWPTEEDRTRVTIHSP